MVLTGIDGLDVLDEMTKLSDKPRVLILSSYIKGGVVDMAAAKGFHTAGCGAEALRDLRIEHLSHRVDHVHVADCDNDGFPQIIAMIADRLQLERKKTQ